MTSLLNMLNSLDELNKPNKIKVCNSLNQPTNLLNHTPALTQGNTFNKYQKNIVDRTEKYIYNEDNEDFKEGFSSMDTNTPSLSNQSNNLLNSVKTSDKDIKNQEYLKKEYNDVLKQYNKKLVEVNKVINDYVNRVNPNNPYLNKIIRFTKGEIGYVTNKGVVKLIPSTQILDSLINSPKQNIININIPWLVTYNTLGTPIPTTPPLISGTNMVLGETCGNEGLNVYVDKLITNPTIKYNGCYKDDKINPVMTFIGKTPPPSNYIVNGNFSQPELSNDSYKYYTSSSAIPGWNFSNGAILNNSRSWGFTMPYPNGTQCVCIQKTASISQTINLSSGNYTLKLMASAKNYKSSKLNTSNISNPINIQLNGTTIYTVNPQINVWNNYTTTFNITKSGNNIITLIGTSNQNDPSTAIQGITLGNTDSNISGTYSYDMCKNSAVDNGFKYFGLQSVNTNTGLGYCSTGNDGVGIYKHGESYVNSGGILLWSSKTSGTGNSASLTNQGSLSVFNSSGAAIFLTTSGKPSDYIGCYGDKSSRAMALVNKDHNYDLASCKLVAQQNNSTYYALQDSTTGKNAQCATSSDLGSIRKYGIATNCTKLTDGTYSGGGFSNAVYNNSESSSFYYLILQDDGNMSVYRGSGPNDNQGIIWSSTTNGQQQKPNSLYSASKGKYGKNWIASGSTLAANDFVGSNDGSIYLIMQPDGNLALYTSQSVLNCKKMKDGNMGGGDNSNALYEISPTGVPSLLGSLGYVDENSMLYTYPNSNRDLSNTYNKQENYDSTGNDLSGKSITNSTVDNCQTICSSNKDCYGFTFNKQNNTCYPKSKTTYPVGKRQTNKDYDLYTRNPKLINKPIGVPDTIVNIDSVSYQNYNTNGETISSSYGFSNVNSTQKKELQQLQTRLNQISQQLVNDTGKNSSNNNKVETQTQNNINGMAQYLKDYNSINEQSIHVDSTENILNDSDIVVLKENYTYLFWSILAVGTILVTMNIAKK